MSKENLPSRLSLASIWVVWCFFAVGSVLWAVIVVLDHFGISDQAGWVQAIGSVVALFGAWYFPYRHGIEAELRADRRLLIEQQQRRKAYLDRVEEICRLAKNCMNIGKQFLGEYQGKSDREVISDALDNAFACLSTINVFEIDDFRVAQDVLLIRSSVATGRGQLKVLISGNSIERDIAYVAFCKCASGVEVGWQRISNIANPAPVDGDAGD